MSFAYFSFGLIFPPQLICKSPLYIYKIFPLFKEFQFFSQFIVCLLCMVFFLCRNLYIVRSINLFLFGLWILSFAYKIVPYLWNFFFSKLFIPIDNILKSLALLNGYQLFSPLIMRIYQVPKIWQIM